MTKDVEEGEKMDEDRKAIRIGAFEEAVKAVESWRTKDHEDVLFRNARKGKYIGFPAGIDAAEGAIADLILREKGELPLKKAEATHHD